MTHLSKIASRLTVAAAIAFGVSSCGTPQQGYQRSDDQPQPNTRIISLRLQMTKNELASASKQLLGCNAMHPAIYNHTAQAQKDMCITGATEKLCQAAGYWQELATMPGSEGIVPDPDAAEQVSAQCPEKLSLIRGAMKAENTMAQHPGQRARVSAPTAGMY